jgi:hypothetical protein
LVTYTPEFVKFSHTVLGKAFSVILILFYVKLDFLSGLFVCALVIFYYQSDYVESFNNMLNEGFTDESKKTHNEDTAKEQQQEQSDEAKEKNKISISENFEILSDAYPSNPNSINPKTCKNAVLNFRKKHCKNGHLIDKGQIIKPEMAEHIYPEIKLSGKSEFNKCNICNSDCDFEIINKRILDETDLINPKSSNDMFEKVWDNLRSSLTLYKEK